MASFDDLHLFVMIVRYQGISAAARACNLQRSKVSRRLQELEKKLGFQLLIRTTHAIELTEQGRWLYNTIHHPINALDAAVSELEEQKSNPSGKLKLAIPPVLGVTEFFTFVIEKYTSLYPDVQVEIEHQNQPIDLARSNTDLQVLPVYSSPVNNDYIQQYFLELPCSMVASPEYLAQHTLPRSITDILEHKVLGSRYCKMCLPSSVDYYVYSEDLHLLRNLARDGKGITILPTVMLKNGIQEGRFIQLLAEHEFRDLKITLVYAAQPYLSKKCRDMVQLLRETVAEEGAVHYPA